MNNTCLSANVEFPDTPAGRRAGEVMDLINKDSKYSIPDYINTCFSKDLLDKLPLSLHKSILQSTQSFYGKIEPIKILESDDYEINFTVKSISQNAFLEVNLMVETEEPYLIKMVLFKPVFIADDYVDAKGKVEDTTYKTLSNNIINKNILSVIKKQIDQSSVDNFFSGIVLITEKESPVFFKSYGYASKRFNVMNELDTRFLLGPASRLFIKVAILQLYENGLLELSDPIGNYINGFPDEVANKTTIKHLLSNQAGWENFYTSGEFDILSLQSVSGYIEQIVKMPLLFDPGTDHLESNTALIVAAAVIEKVSKQNIFDYIKTNVFNKSNMNNSGFYFRDKPADNIATGYTNKHPLDTINKNFLWENTIFIPVNLMPTDGIYTTADDLHQMGNALTNNNLINEGSINLLFTEFAPSNINSDHTEFISWKGEAPGINTIFAIKPEKEIMIIVLSNYDPPAANNITNIVMKSIIAPNE